MAFKQYRWDDVGAPVLHRIINSLPQVVNACLVTGYGSKSGAGWTAADSDAGQAAYLQGAGVGAQHFFNVQHSSVSSVRLLGFIAMTGAGVGSGQFPTIVQDWQYGYMGVATGDPNQWIIFADARTVYIFVRDEASAEFGWLSWGFGDLHAYQPGDQHACFISNNLAEYDNASAPEYLAQEIGGAGSPVMRKKFLMLGGEQRFSGAIGGGVSYPNQAGGQAILSPFFCCENAGATVLRGELKGLWAPCHPQPYGHLDTFSGVGDLAGKQFMAINVRGQYIASWDQGYHGQIVVEISDTLPVVL